jgi:hypothetical protein
MKVKTSELSGAALDWAVGQADECDLAPVEYSTKWEFGGPIIEREGIDLQYQGGETDVWAADIFNADSMIYGDTPLVAAMRCYVASKLGDEVEVSDELLEGESK